jgi:hypothetical protein
MFQKLLRLLNPIPNHSPANETTKTDEGEATPRKLDLEAMRLKHAPNVTRAQMRALLGITIGPK